MSWVRGAETPPRQDPHSLGGWPTHGRIITITEQGVWAPCWVTQLWDPALGKTDPRMFGFEGQHSEGYEKSHALGPRAGAVIWRETESDPPAGLGGAPIGQLAAFAQHYERVPWASQVVPVGKNLSANAGDIRHGTLIPGSGRFPGGGHGNPL